MSEKKDLLITQGSTFTQEVRWETSPIIYKPITGITKTAPVGITVPGHGMPDGWRATVVSVKGMSEINASIPPREKDYRAITLIDADNIQFNDVNASDFTTYSGGGYVQYNSPVDLTGYTARMEIKDRVGGTVLATLTDANGKIILDTTNKVIKLKLLATETAGYTWNKGVYDLELVSATGDVTALLYGAVTVSKEVTT